MICNTTSIDISIRPVENKAGEYVAYLKAEFLEATFFLYFKDDILRLGRLESILPYAVQPL